GENRQQRDGAGERPLRAPSARFDGIHGRIVCDFQRGEGPCLTPSPGGRTNPRGGIDARLVQGKLIMAEAAVLTGGVKADASAAVKAKGYIVSPLYDNIFFITAPLSAFVLGVVVYLSNLPSMRVRIFSHEGSPDTIFLGSFIMAHLFIVFFRSNGNKK